MNTNQGRAGEFNQLVDNFIANTLSDDGLVRLESHLRGNAAAQRFFLKYCQLHVDLAVDSRATDAMQSFCEQQQKQAFHLNASEAAAMNTAAPPQALSRARLWPLTGAAVFAAATVVLIALWSFGVGPASKSPESSPLVERNSRRKESEKLASQLPVITALNANARTTTLQLEGIGYVTVDGPTDFCLVGPMRARLNYGRVTMRVTEKTGQGFVIETPDGEVTDLGTEFALNVTRGSDTSLIVREGMVDLRVGALPQANKPQRLVIGDGVTFDKEGRLDRLMSIVSTDEKPFQTTAAEHFGEKPSLIRSVTDSLRTSDTRKFYEIVPGGLREDARAYVDRDYEWNGCDESGMPEFLLGAEYVRTFNDYKRRAFKIELELSRPADVYVFWDERAPHADWLLKEFVDTGLFIGIDESPGDHSSFNPGALGVGPGSSVDNHCSIWRRSVNEAGRVELGAINRRQSRISMYGIAVTEIGREIPIEPAGVDAKQ